MDGFGMARRYETEDERWAALSARDTAADGSFVTAVLTTGIFCRPVCPARRPNRENIRFYDGNAAALAAGFRPCKRCRPTGEAIDERWRAAIERACRLIETEEETPRLADLAEAAGLSPYHFHRVFKRLVGVTPKEYVASRQAGRLRAELAAGTPVAEAVYGAGYGSPSRVYEAAGQRLGMTPAVYRKGGAGERIRWALVPTALGDLILAATERGICLLEFAEAGIPPERRVASRFSKAEIERAEQGFAAEAARIAAYIDLPAGGLDLPLDIQGTAFQQRVWQALRAIPVGETATYGEIARRIGQPTAARAVAQACADNKVALAVPCHRVVAGNGGLGGYRWGTERKARLLEGERG